MPPPSCFLRNRSAAFLALLGTVLFLVSPAIAGTSHSADALSADGNSDPSARIDALVFQHLNRAGTEPPEICSDAVFIRRVYLDVIGTLPSAVEVREFLQDSSPDKRRLLIDRLLERDEFADYWAMKWSDLLRVKAEFPINLWPNAAQAYSPLDSDEHPAKTCLTTSFVRELLTSSGSNFRVPPVNFYRAMQSREPAGIAQAVALDLHGHAGRQWPENELAGHGGLLLARSATNPPPSGRRKSSSSIPQRRMRRASSRATSSRTARRRDIAAGSRPARGLRRLADRRRRIPGSRGTSRTASGPGCLGAASFTSRTTSGPTIRRRTPSCWPCWSRSWSRSHYDLKHLYRLILNSRTYQLSSISRRRRCRGCRAISAHYPCGGWMRRC